MINETEKNTNKFIKAFQMDTKTLVTMGILVAIQIVFSRFLSINAWNLRIGFGFLPIVVAAIMFGPVKAGIVAGVSDILGAILFSFGFTPLLTVTAILVGVVFGLFLHKKQTVINIVISVLIVQIVCSLLLNSYILYILYFSDGGGTLLAYMLTRVGQTIIMIPIQIFSTIALGKILLPKLHLITAKN